MRVDMKVEGFRDLDRALAELPRAAARSTARRAMKAELQPVAETANAFWPGDSDDVFQIVGRVKRGQPQPQKGSEIINLFVGAVNTPEAHLVEWGTGPRYHEGGRYTGQVAPQPALTPAWDMHKRQVLDGLSRRIATEIKGTMERAARKAARQKAAG